MSYSPEQLELDAALIADCGLPYGSYKDEVAAVYRAYAATLRQQAARVDEGVSGLCQRNPAPNAAQPMAATSPTVRLEAALSAQPAEQQGEAVACRYRFGDGNGGWLGWHYSDTPTKKTIPGDAVQVEPLYTHPAAPVGVPDGMVLVPREPTTKMLDAGIEDIDYDGNEVADNVRNVWLSMLAAAPSAPQGEG